MTLKQIVEDNFYILLTSMNPSHDLLGRLFSVPFIKDRISSICQQLNDKNFALLNALRDVPADIQESVMNGFILALRETGQDHVANIFRRENNKVIMSLEHRQLLCEKRPDLCNFLNPTGELRYCLVSSGILSDTDVQKVLSKAGLSEMADEMIVTLVRKSDDAFDHFITSLHETGQSHVAYILTGEGNSRPLKKEHRKRLLDSRMFLVDNIDSRNSNFVTALICKGVFSSSEAERVTSGRTSAERNELILDLIARKSQSDFSTSSLL